MTYSDPDFAFLFLKVDWQAARKRILRAPFNATATATATTWVSQATVSPALTEFSTGFESNFTMNPAADFDQCKAGILVDLVQQKGAQLRHQINNMRFYREYLVIFPELFFTTVPAIFFSAQLYRSPTLSPA